MVSIQDLPINDDTSPISEEELSYWLAFSQMKGLKMGEDQFVDILDLFDNLINVWKASKQELVSSRLFRSNIADAFIEQREKAEPARLLDELHKHEVTALPFTHPHYPIKLRHIHSPPYVLYMKGKLEPADLRNTLGIVGTRNPTAYGRKLAKQFSRELALVGATIVSGMAVGIDSLAHWGALEAGGKTVAVLASGVDHCYPSANRPLYEKLIEQGVGAVVSEYFPGTPPEKWRFPARNRIVSGISDGLLVIEAGESSGALITANLAFNQSRTVFAIPGRIDSPMSVGTNNLILKLVGHIVTKPEDILDNMGWVKTKTTDLVPTVIELFGREKEVYDLLSNEPIHFDFICNEIGMAAGELSGTLTILELAGVVERHPGEWFSRLET